MATLLRLSIKAILTLILINMCFVVEAQYDCPFCFNSFANIIFNDNDVIQNQSFQNQVIDINGTVYIDGSCVFTQCDIYLSEKARIELMPGSTSLELYSNNLLNCCEQYMWDGIYTSDIDNLIVASDNYLLHGENAIVESFGAEVHLENNEFDRCYYAVTLKDWTGSPKITFIGNTIQCSTNISAQPIPPAGKTEIGIKIENYQSNSSNILTIGDGSSISGNNTFHEINQGIVVSNSDLIAVNNRFEEVNSGILFENQTQSKTFSIGGTALYDKNLFINVDNFGIYATGSAKLEINNNYFEGGFIYAILLNLIVFDGTAAYISHNEFILDINSAYAIDVNGFSGNLRISENTIETQLYSGIPASTGNSITIILPQIQTRG